MGDTQTDGYTDSKVIHKSFICFQNKKGMLKMVA
jgi:hypothetical protein